MRRQKNKMTEVQRPDGRQPEDLREMNAEVGIIPNADGSAKFKSGKTIAIAAVYGPKEMHPQHKQNPDKGVLRCNYSMASFAVEERGKPGPSRRSTEISKVMEWALEPVLELERFPSTVVDVHVQIIQADAGTRCAGINAASMALAHAGIPMKSLVSSISSGKLDKTVVVDLDKAEEDFEGGEGPTDIPISMTDEGEITHLQLDGKINSKELKDAIGMAKGACEKIYEVQKQALKDSTNNRGQN